jgi:hypothetical protein
MFDEKSFAFSHGYTVSDKMLTAIGCTVICQSHIELQLSLLIMKLLGVEYQKGCALTAGMSFKNLCATLSSLVLQAVEETDDQYRRFKELMGKIQHFEELRNQVAHSVWAHGAGFGSERALRLKTTARQGKGVKHQSEEVEIARLSKAIHEANKAQVEMVCLIAEITGQSIPSLEA